MAVDIPAAPGRKARQAELSVPLRQSRDFLRPSRPGLWRSAPIHTVTLVIDVEINPAKGEALALWFLITTHQVNDIRPMRAASSASTLALDH